MEIKKVLNSVLEIVVLVVIALAIVIPVRTYVFQPFVVNGASMEPSFYSGDYLIVDEFTYNFIKEPQRGDVVVFDYPLNPNFKYIKRIIGLPGETISIKDGVIMIKTISGEEVVLNEEEYLSADLIKEWVYSNDLGEQTLGDQEYFVMGDNRNGSSDSRKWGTLPEKNIDGKVLFRFSIKEPTSQKIYD
ncbi:MAG: signal peptidase I [Candidatus Pacebacteria bacterium]|nr:signal peptidase I [Candidatus Paceibacterota bacterium]MDD3919198.1 signal peptidase I [Candidatus Paceibacterota bacterium]